jgi:Tol biopolymer transport system component
MKLKKPVSTQLSILIGLSFSILTGVLVANQTNVAAKLEEPQTPSSVLIPSKVNGRIVIASDRVAPGNCWHVYTMKADGTDLVKLTPGGSGEHNFEPVWAPDGARIAYAGGGIHIINADGSNKVDVFTGGDDPHDPAWSPDGKKITFDNFVAGNRDIYSINIDGTNLTRLTTDAGSDVRPAWSPDGARIAFERSGAIWVMNVDGTGQVLYRNSGNSPDWSPDGARIAYIGTGGVRVTDGVNDSLVISDPNANEVRWSADGTRLTLTTQRDGNLEVYTANVDGTSQLNVTNAAGRDANPSWQSLRANGAIAFETDRDGNSEIYRMNPDGSTQTNISNNPANDGFASWSADGLKIAFYSGRDGNPEIYAMNGDGTSQTRITNNAGDDFHPSWSPDRTKLVFGRFLNDGSTGDIFSINADGSGETNLSQNGFFVNSNPAWSPDGSRILFNTSRDSHQEVYVMKNDGSLQTRLTDTASGFSALGAWSPDASRITFMSSRDGNAEIYVMNSDGSNPLRLTNNAAADVDPTWSPDGSKIVFSSDRDTGGSFRRQIYLMNADGSGVMRLTNNSASDGFPAWQPQPAFMISGHVKDGANTPVAGVAISLSGNVSVTTYTDANGYYSFSNLAGGPGLNYTVSGAKAGYLVSPANQTFNNLFANQTADFTAALNAVQLSSSSYTANEGTPSSIITINRSGDTSTAATIDYATSDTAGANDCNAISGVASSRCDYLSTIGTLHFAANETSKTISIPIIDDSYAEGSESLTITLSNPVGVSLGAPASATITITDNEATNGTNPIDVSSFFVRQHYIDFLNREPDTGGLNFWIDQIENCTPKPQCTEIRRINVSAAFFLSIEFQETGYLVYRFYKSAYGNIPGTPVPVRLIEFLPDTQQIGKGVVIGQPGAEQQLEANKVAFALDFVSRSRFTAAYPTTLTPAQFVDALFTNAGVTPSATDRNAAISEFGGAGNTADTAARARALRRVAENSILKQQETNKAFVLMQYFGYLRRNPNDPPEAGLNFDGYNFWLGKLNEFNGNFVNAEMVKAFIVSGEYRHRFGP